MSAESNQEANSVGYTPGPWHVGGYLHGRFVYDANGCFIADCGSIGKSIDELAANARLIAAVPELLAEMERYLRVIERAEASPQWSGFTTGTGIATANGYRAAIAKAKGVTR